MKIRAAERWDLAFSRLKFKLVKNPEKTEKKGDLFSISKTESKRKLLLLKMTIDI